MISDKAIVDWVDKNEGLTLTRFSCNNKDPTNVRYVCLTGDRFILQRFFYHIYPKIQTKFYLFIVETDWYFLYQEWLDKDNLEKVFAWNKIVDHPKMNALPIGINHKRMFESLSTYCIEEKPKQLLLVNFNVKTNPFRKRLLSLLETKFGNCQSVDFKDYKNEELIEDKSHIEGTITQQKTTSQYYDMLTGYKFCVSPFGAGLDCHRTWECLYLGVIPIVLTSELDEIYKDLPVLIVKSWDCLNKKYLQKKYKLINQRLQDGYYNLDKMDFNYWVNSFQNKILDT